MEVKKEIILGKGKKEKEGKKKTKVHLLMAEVVPLIPYKLPTDSTPFICLIQ